VQRAQVEEGREKIVRLGVIVPNLGPIPMTLGISAMARAVEAAAADSAWVSDHLLLVDRPMTGYPYSKDGNLPLPTDTPFLETMACCAVMSAVTERIRIGTSILILPQRNVLEVAKVAASIDQLSGGRLALGVGMGWNRAEMEALGYGWTTRRQRFIEMLEVLRDCWSGRPKAYSGAEVRIPHDVVLAPRPAQPEGPPLLVGGMKAPSRDIAATRGDGWMAIAFSDAWDASGLQHDLDDVKGRRVSAEEDRSFESLLKIHASPSDDANLMPELVADARRMGFDEVLIDVPWMDGAAEVERFIGRAREAAIS
jgi:probable F420-dependent oxidoreductase